MQDRLLIELLEYIKQNDLNINQKILDIFKLALTENPEHNVRCAYNHILTEYLLLPKDDQNLTTIV